jgi:hypothetical protein
VCADRPTPGLTGEDTALREAHVLRESTDTSKTGLEKRLVVDAELVGAGNRCDADGHDRQHTAHEAARRYE